MSKSVPKKNSSAKLPKSATLIIPKKSYLLRNLTIIASLVFIILLAFGYILYSQFETTVETRRSEIKVLPSDVKQSLQKKAALSSPSATIHVPILLYHYVEYVQDKGDTFRESLNINPDIFDSQVATIQKAGYTFITAKDLADVLDGRRTLPDKPVILTIDDGHWDLATDILPILKKYNAHATAYIIPGFIGRSDFLSPKQLQEVIDSGLVEIGAHTVHHIALKGKLDPIVKYEVAESRAMLEKDYHVHVYSFAYPNGSFDEQAIKEVKDAGFMTAVSTIPGSLHNQEDRFFLYRLRPGRRTGQSLIQLLQATSFDK